MIISFHPQAWEDYLHWQKSDRPRLRRINALIRAVLEDAERGIGKPEPLKFNFSGYWSRRIDDEHRVVYKVADEEIILAQLRGRYD
ncbi:MAG: Txe/YoeB family addiction module toxin [Azonexus sp.]|jgi:toxin YoeB|nr:Txe/YoeB family addiction module toxin [Betaproteobacteria bacterium]MBK8919229.1 Txe/YoeB family addiction module toxin [Betaproteobacteria bacterium]MBP6035157.1 Txe/YoeB family addiction module toxin [Azonexus sp.]MBP6905740.1 Txe/YoeB family addiction module toxin [Azonexus sp.]